LSTKLAKVTEQFVEKMLRYNNFDFLFFHQKWFAWHCFYSKIKNYFPKTGTLVASHYLLCAC